MEGIFSDSQLDKLSDILIVVGQVLFASVIVPFFMGIDSVKFYMLISSLGLMVISWVLSLYVVRGREQ